jgi:hypothetical protein
MPRASGSTPSRRRTASASRTLSKPSTVTRRVGRHQRVEHAQRGGLAGAVGAEQAGDLAVAGGKLTPCTAFTGPVLLAKVLCRSLTSIMAIYGSQP